MNCSSICARRLPCMQTRKQSAGRLAPLLGSHTQIRWGGTFKPRMLSKAEKAAQLNKYMPQLPSDVAKRKKEKEAKKPAKPKDLMYPVYDLSSLPKFDLCDAIRYIQASEVGNDPRGTKYDLAVKIKTRRDGPTVRNRLRLPHPVITSLRVAIICPPNSRAAEQASAAGAVLVGEDEIFDNIKAGKIDFDLCICHTDSVTKLNKAGVARTLGPRGLMPSTKSNTISPDPAALMRSLLGSSEYRERNGVVRMAIGQLGFVPEQLAQNIKTVIDAIKRDIARMTDKISRDIDDVVLSASHSPAFSLSGRLRDPKWENAQ